MDDQGRTSQLFGAGPLGDRVTPMRDSISAIQLEPKTIVADYLVRQVKIRRLVEHIVGSRLFDAWFRVSPAIKEMICLGKVEGLVEERTWWRKEPVWDLVIFDAPATGHGLGLLRLPEQAAKLLIGPMRTNALSVQGLLTNQKTTGLLIVTIPEDMPVNEAVHFHDEARAHTSVPLSGVVLNAAAPARFDAASAAALPAALAGAPLGPLAGALFGDPAVEPGAGAATSEVLARAAAWSQVRAETTARYRDELRARIPDLPLVEVPFVFAEQFATTELEQVALLLERGLTAAGLLAPAQGGAA